MEITKREVLASVAIMCIMLVLGLLIQQSIRTYISNQNKEYELALQIEDPATFKYAMKTNAGNAFVYGKLKTVDPVSVDGIDGEWMWVQKATERYTRHSRTITKKVGKRTITEIQYYYTWDRVSSEIWHCTKVSFLDTEFNYGTISASGSNYIRCDRRGNYRDKWFTGSLEHTGTIFTKLHDGTIEKTDLREGKTIKEAYDSMLKDETLILVFFWILWVGLTAGLCFGFYALDNWWLE